MGSAQEGGADGVLPSCRAMGKPCQGVSGRKGHAAPPKCVSDALTFGLAKSPPCTAHPSHKVCRESSGLVAAIVRLSDKAGTTNTSWFSLEQDPCGHRPSMSPSPWVTAQWVVPWCWAFSHAGSDPSSGGYSACCSMLHRTHTSHRKEACSR